MAGLLPLASEKYERSNEQQTRKLLEDRLYDLESQIYAFRTTFGTLRLNDGDITLANGANNNIAIGYATYVRIAGPSGSFSISGFSSGELGRFLVLRNTTAQQMTVTNDATSSAANRIYTNTGGDVVLTGAGGSVAVFMYDATATHWILIATQG
jgi:hypothetical protein